MSSMDDSGNIQEMGGKLLTALNVVLRSMRLYPEENEQVQQAIDDLQGQMGTLLASEGSFDLNISGDFFFLNEVRLRLDLSNFSTFGNLASVLASHGIGEVSVGPGVERDEWAPFVTLLLGDPDDDPFEGFFSGLSGSQVKHIDVQPEAEAAEPELVERDALAEAKGTYAKSSTMSHRW